MRCPDAFTFIASARPRVAKPTVFLLGAGYIGGAILDALLATDRYAVSVLVRSKDQADHLALMGVTPILADLDASAVIREAAKRSDVR